MTTFVLMDFSILPEGQPFNLFQTSPTSKSRKELADRFPEQAPRYIAECSP